MEVRVKSKFTQGGAGRARALLAAALAAAVSALGVGCGGGANVPEIAEGAYTGPPLTIDPSGRAAVIVMEAPTPGWVLTLDRTSEARDHWRAFVTVRRPSPAFVYPQVLVRQNLLTTVEPGRPLRVYARVLESADTAGGQQYHEAARAEASRAAPPSGP